MNVCDAALPDVSDLVVGALPVDLQTAAVNGLWFNMAGCNGLNALLIAAIGTAGDDPIITLEQAKTSGGGSAKELTIRRLDYKIGATGFTSVTDIWRRVTTIDQDNPVTSYDTDGIAGAENALLLNVFILPTDLDIANNFKYVRLNCADVGGNAQLGCILYIPSKRHYQGAHNYSALA